MEGATSLTPPSIAAVFNSQQESAGVIDPEGQEKQLINVRNK